MNDKREADLQMTFPWWDKNEADIFNGFPFGDYTRTLGPRVCAELEAAKPEESHDSGVLRDRFLLNHAALTYWLYLHFGMNTRTLAGEELSALNIDPVNERITIDGVDYKLPHWCFFNTGVERGDVRPRPTGWPEHLSSNCSITPPISHQETADSRNL